MKIGVKRVGKPLEIVETQKRYRTECVKEHIGEDQYAEYVLLNKEGTFALGVNENGLPLELPVNFLLSTTSPYFPIQKMVGTIVFVRTKDMSNYKGEIWDYEVEDITAADIEYIERLLNEEIQTKLKERFADYGKGYAVVEPVE